MHNAVYCVMFVDKIKENKVYFKALNHTFSAQTDKVKYTSIINNEVTVNGSF